MVMRVVVLTAALVAVGVANAASPAALPNSFNVVWNVPAQGCTPSLDPAPYSILTNKDNAWYDPGERDRETEKEGSTKETDKVRDRDIGHRDM